MRRLVIAAGVVAVGSGLVTAVGAATPWADQSTPNVTGALAQGLRGVSCVAGTCTAVGLYEDAAGRYRTLVERG